ncbi:hypothetical protein [Bacillus sp. FJAT-27445]|uniref:hypothetical protein n=1 Tax=Bacillus sp. FJAT-27445 TaxID=1679166 RepID=UPI00074325E9|nr:hypothetical protein [Bacillus sp. FJAT-27445]
MKLIGSKTEQEIRKLLIKSNELLFKSEEERRLLEVIKSSCPEMITAYILHWIPEQGEDIYKILINDSIIAVIELDRNNFELEPKVETLTISQYLKGLSKQNRIKLAVALDLAKQDLKDKY